MDNLNKAIDSYNNLNANNYEVTLIDNGAERLFARCKEERDCYRKMTAFLMSQGYKKEYIFYYIQDCDNYKSISSIGDYKFRLYSKQKEI